MYIKTQTDADGYVRVNFPSSVSWNPENVYAFATVESNEPDSVTFAVSITALTNTYVEFRVRRIEQASGLIGAILSTFFRPAANHSAKLHVNYDLIV